jgi:RNA-binding protein YlmH
VRSIKVETRPMAAEDLQVAAPRVEQRTSVEASTRVDAVASAGFRMSRSKMADLIKKGDVRCCVFLVDVFYHSQHSATATMAADTAGPAADGYRVSWNS